jgi:hypothetical protein
VLGTVEANGGCCYEFNAPTPCDSAPACNYWTQFCVTAHTGAIGEHFDSPVDSGYSVDNLGMLRLTSQRKPGTGDAGAVAGTRLEVPRPNPGKDGFKIRFTLAADDWIQLAVYDIKGRRVASISEGFTTAGTHEATWNADSEVGERLSPGLYFVRLVTTTEVRTVKLLHL